ncbi:MAG: hypothetical protein R2991_14820, partial [Thermoanaerobaculia bacterium]
NGHPRTSDRPVEVVVGVDGETVATLEVTGDWKTYPVPLGSGRGDFALLTLDVSPTFRPYSDFRRYPDLAPSEDIRCLGVAVREPAARPAAIR